MTLVTDAMIQAAFDYFNEQAEAAAQAKADLVIAEYRRKKTRAGVILHSLERTIALREAEADSHPSVEQACTVEAEATKRVEWHRHMRARAEAIIAAWRTQEANQRGMSHIT
jgi:ABC-type Fe3+-citrate transport system substrate-binding protein